jgi:hypothetical protein
LRVKISFLTLFYLYLFIIWGCFGFDWRLYGKWARSQNSSMT